jgi:hypothetical protein
VGENFGNLQLAIFLFGCKIRERLHPELLVALSMLFARLDDVFVFAFAFVFVFVCVCDFLGWGVQWPHPLGTSLMTAPRQHKSNHEEADDAIVVSAEAPVHAPASDLSERVSTLHRATGCGKIELCVMRHRPR